VAPDANLVHYAGTVPSNDERPVRNRAADQGGADGSPLIESASANNLSELIGAAKNIGQLQRERTARRERAMQ
jgi:hypothetical protein